MLIDRHIRLVFTDRGPEYWNLECLQRSSLRRVRNLYYTQEFAQMVFQEFLMHEAKAGVQKNTN